MKRAKSSAAKAHVVIEEDEDEEMADRAAEEFLAWMVSRHGTAEVYRRTLNSFACQGGRVETSTLRLLSARGLHTLLENREPLSADFLSLLLTVYPKAEWNKLPDRLLVPLAGVLTWYALQYIHGVEEPEWESFKIAVKQAFGGLKKLPDPMHRQLCCLLGCEGSLPNLEGWLHSHSPHWDTKFDVIDALDTLGKESYYHVINSSRIHSLLTILHLAGKIEEQNVAALIDPPKSPKPHTKTMPKISKPKPPTMDPKGIPDVEQMREMPISALLDMFYNVFGYKPDVKEKMTLIKKLHGYAQRLLDKDGGDEVESPWMPVGAMVASASKSRENNKRSEIPGIHVGKFVYKVEGQTQITGTVYKYDNKTKTYQVMYETGGLPEEYTEVEIEPLLIDHSKEVAEAQPGHKGKPLENALLDTKRATPSFSRDQEAASLDESMHATGKAKIDDAVSADEKGSISEDSELYVPFIVPRSKRILVEKALKLGAKKATVEILQSRRDAAATLQKEIPIEMVDYSKVVVAVRESEEKVALQEETKGLLLPKKRHLYRKMNVQMDF